MAQLKHHAPLTTVPTAYLELLHDRLARAHNAEDWNDVDAIIERLDRLITLGPADPALRGTPAEGPADPCTPVTTVLPWRVINRGDTVAAFGSVQDAAAFIDGLSEVPRSDLSITWMGQAI